MRNIDDVSESCGNVIDAENDVCARLPENTHLEPMQTVKVQ